MNKDDVFAYKLIVAIMMFVLLIITTILGTSAVKTITCIANQYRLKSFQAIEATIEDCFIVQGTSRHSSSRNTGTVGFYPRFILRYSFEGKTYTIDTKTRLSTGMSLEKAYDYLKKMAPDQKFTYIQNYYKYLRPQDRDVLNDVKTAGVKKNTMIIHCNPERPEECDLLMSKENPWPAIPILLLFFIPLFILLRLSFIKLGKPGLLIPSIVVLLAVSALMVFAINVLVKRQDNKDFNPYFSISIGRSYNSNVLKQYMSPQDQEDF